MSGRKRRAIDLRSQDLTVDDMKRFRQTFLDSSVGGNKLQELIMFSSKAQPFQFSNLEEFGKELRSVPSDAEYFHYTITHHKGDRCSLYLDPDRPARIVVEGSDGFVNELGASMERTFPKGSVRYKAQGSAGYFIIWGVIVSVAIVFILAYTLGTRSDVNPYLVAWTVFVSSLLGIYLSIVKSRDINPANTMSLGSKKRRPMVDILMHFITVSLGIISVILVLLFVEFNL